MTGKMLLGWLEHAFVGACCVLLGARMGEPARDIVVWATAIGFMHEGTQQLFSDFRHAANPPAPWNGILDLVWFMVPAVIWAIL